MISGLLKPREAATSFTTILLSFSFRRVPTPFLCPEARAKFGVLWSKRHVRRKAQKLLLGRYHPKSRPVTRYASLNIFPFALNVYPGCFLHFLNSFGLFFRCSSADATASALGMSAFLATEKHVDLWCEIRRTNL